MPKRNNRTRSWQRTAEMYRDLGYLVAKTEYTHRGKSHDLLGIIDGLALGIGETIGLQACGVDFQPHVRKILGSHQDKTKAWLAAGNRLVIVGWRKLKKGKQERWTPRVQEITWADFQ